ncbi:MAG: hypothetical protein AAFQ87_13540 [Bacteroidota bacterium]
MKHYLLSIFLLISSFCFAQDRPASSNESYRKACKRHSAAQIKGLHNGVLLVRLQTKQSTIDALRERGKARQAVQVEADQKRYNQALVVAFQHSFDFCPVYFFYSHYTQVVKEGKLDSVEFLDENLLPTRDIPSEKSYFLVAEVTSVVGDTAKHFDHYYVEPTANGPERKAAYYGGNNFGFRALVMKSDQFIQLTRPFPYYERLLQKSMPTIVSGMNQNLHRFYDKTIQKQKRKAKRKANRNRANA